MSIFYNSARFPPQLPPHFSSFLFSGCSVFLVWNSNLFMDRHFFFQETSSRATSFSLRQAFSHPFQYMTRINRELSMNLYQTGSNTRLATLGPLFRWQPQFGREVSSFFIIPQEKRMQKDPDFFSSSSFWINDGTIVDLILSTYERPETPVYLTVNPSTKLLSTSRQPPSHGYFQFRLDPRDPRNHRPTRSFSIQKDKKDNKYID